MQSLIFAINKLGILYLSIVRYYAGSLIKKSTILLISINGISYKTFNEVIAFAPQTFKIF